MANGLVKRYGKGTDSDATDTLIAETVRSHPRPGSNSDGNIAIAGVREGASVRRLMPVECERLQALPDGWTDLGNTADSKRYAALGDAVTSSVAEWIGWRILDATITVPATAGEEAA